MSDVLSRLSQTIEARAHSDTDQSYTASLLAKGPAKCAEKFGEEAVEAVIAAAVGDIENLKCEAADVLFHLQVMLRARGVSWADVMAELERREGTSGIEEKNSRT